MNPRESVFEMQMCNCRLRLLLHRDLCMWLCAYMSVCVCVCAHVGVGLWASGGKVRWLVVQLWQRAHQYFYVKFGQVAHWTPIMVDFWEKRFSKELFKTSLPSESFAESFLFLVGARVGLNPKLLSALSTEEQKKKDVEEELERSWRAYITFL